MITLLSYPRSGRNLLSHMLCKIGIEVKMTHRPIIHKEWPLKSDDKLILLLRDYSECIPRHLYTEQMVSAEMMSKIFGREFGIRDRASQYFENIVLFDLCQCPKYVVYYEDIMNRGIDEFTRLAYWIDYGLSSPWGHVHHGTRYKFYREQTIPDKISWEKECQISLQKYDSPALSDGEIDYHKKRVEDIGHLHKVMKDTNPYIFEKYLSRYEEIKNK